MKKLLTLTTLILAISAPGVMNLDGKMILPLDNYTGAISYDYTKGFVICGAFGSIGDADYQKICYDENGNKTTA